MKKAIDWIALVVGVALALFGAKWMWTGWDIVQAERGWAAVIAGSVMLSGGLIVAMLAWTVMRITGANGAVARRAAPVDEAPASPIQQPAAPAPSAGIVAAGAGAIAAGSGAIAAAGVALARDETLAEEAAGAAPDAPVDTPRTRPATPPSVSDLLRRSEDRGRDPLDGLDAELDEALAPSPPPLETAAEIAPPASPGVEEEVKKEVEEKVVAAGEAPAPSLETPAVVVAPEPLDKLILPEPPPIEPPSLEAEPAKPEPEPARAADTPQPPAPVDEPVYDDWLERTAREFDRELGRDALPKDEPPPVEAPPPSPPQPEPAVVGRYSSGDTNYLMFADGSIEAQTPEGVMRFASLTELKRFVEKRN